MILTEWLSGAPEEAARLGRPLVTVSYAQSLDGCLSVRRGRPTALSGPESLRAIHAARAAHQAVLVGIGTVRSDNPRLDVSLVSGKKPRPIVLDTYLRIPLDCQLLDRTDKKPWIITSEPVDPHKKSDLEKRGAQIIISPQDKSGKLDLNSVLEELFFRGIFSLMVEGGARVINSFLAQRLADQVMVTLCPVWLAGLHGFDESLAFIGDDGPTTWPALAKPVYEQYGRDLIVFGKLGEETF
jgi:3,4-dihydroxy 2-butanone 4-phosphate synthase/GTP cyclohydrolase II